MLETTANAPRPSFLQKKTRNRAAHQVPVNVGKPTSARKRRKAGRDRFGRSNNV